MADPRVGASQSGKPMHYSAGAVIQDGEKYLLIDRMQPPLGFAGIAGHVDVGESPEEAVRREVKEESGLTVTTCQLVCEEERERNRCRRGVSVHYWYVFACEVTGQVVWNRAESKSIGWYTKEQVKALALEPIWAYWFTRLGVQ